MKFRSRAVLLILMSLMTGFLLAAAPVELSVMPQPVRAGEEAYLVIRSRDGSRPQPQDALPEIDGLSWHQGVRQSSRTQIINGRRSDIFELYVPFTVDKPGNYTIPPMRLTKHSGLTKKITFQAVEARYRTSSSPRSSGGSADASDGVTMNEIMFMELEVPGGKNSCYLGEEIPLEVNIYVLAGVQPQLSWPQVSFGSKDGAVFRDYRQTNPENPNFAGVTQHRTERNGREYILYSFRTAVRPITAGKLEISAGEEAALVVPAARRQRSMDPFDEIFDDPFFSRGRRIARALTAGPVTLDVRNLPPVPAGVRFTGLVGEWESRVTLSPPPYKVGEPITLKVEFEGTGSADTLRHWPLELKGFRVYPPEVEKVAGGAELRYVLIPMEASDGKADNVFFGPYAVFSMGKYRTEEFRRAIPVENGRAVIPGAAAPVVVSSAPAAENAVKEQPVRRRAEEILYLKKREGRGVPLPPEVNIAGGLVLILGGALFLIVSGIVYLVRRARENDPAYQRRAQARNRKTELLRRLGRLEPGDIPGSCSGDIASYLADAEGLAPGADLTECAEAVRTKSPELAKLLDELSQAAWMPSMRDRFTPEFRRALIKALGRIVMLAVLFGLGLPSMLSAADDISRDRMEAMTAYDAGKFAEAEKYYRKKLDPAEPSAEELYNIGNCLYQQGKLPRAMLCYERALRLSPRDSDILENLNLVRRKLMRPELGRVGSPGDILPYLRDSLRPDEWLFVLFGGVSLILIAAGTALLGYGRVFRILLIAGVLLILLPGAAYLSQRSTRYDPDFALVVTGGLPVYSLPSDQAGKVEMKLHAGEEVQIAERRMNWVRVRAGAAEGWVHAGDVVSLWNPDSAGDL
ncbi:MAG: BatD family protein [Lentisphaeria bacterium]|nr:BatD family protein [Lentisphaeria bacterium]